MKTLKNVVKCLVFSRLYENMYFVPFFLNIALCRKTNLSVFLCGAAYGYRVSSSKTTCMPLVAVVSRKRMRGEFEILTVLGSITYMGAVRGT